jgi:long-chain acyl-CoA synthetase
MNLVDVLLGLATSTPDAPALLDAAARFSHGELVDRAARLAGGLLEEGIEPGDRVAIAGTNDPAFVMSYLGVLKAGGVVVPLNPQAPGAELRRELTAVEPRLVLCGPTAVEHLTSATDEAMVRRIDNAGEGLDRWDPVPTVHRDDADVAVLLFTAGTAGPPKAAMLTHRNLTANIRQVLDHPGLTLRSADVGLGVLPLFHVFGLTVGLGVPLAAGASVVLAAHFDAAETLTLVRSRGVTVVAAVPAMYVAWLSLPDGQAPPDSFASVRLAVSGAAALPPEVAEGLRNRFGLVVHEGYGLTEAAPVVTTTAIGAGAPRVGSIGPPLPGVDVRLVDVDGSDVLAGDAGEIWVRGPNVFPGYWRDPDATARVLTDDGWLRTGDVAVVDDNGELSLVDRSKDLIIVSGFNVYPAEVEEVLLAHPDVAEAAVVGEPDPRTGEAVTAFVVAEPGRHPSGDGLRAHCAHSLARYKCPARVEVVDAIPRSFAGKVLRRELRGPERSRGDQPGITLGE